MPGKRITNEQRAHAVEMVAGGSSYSEVAAVLNRPKRTVERLFAPGAPLRHAVDRLLRERELAAHHAAVKRARSAGVAPPTHPDAVREERQAHADAARALRESRVAHAPLRSLTEEQSADIAYLRFLRTPDDEIAEMLDGRRPIPSRHTFGATRGFMRSPSGGSVLHGAFGLPTIAEQSGFHDTGAPGWAATDPFEGMYAK